LNKFLDIAFTNKSVEGKINCPYPKFNLKKWQTREATFEHLILHHFPKGYTFWPLHDETIFVQNTIETLSIFQSNEHKVSGHDPIRVMINDAFGNLDPCQKKKVVGWFLCGGFFILRGVFYCYFG